MHVLAFTGEELTIIHIFEDQVIAKSVYTIKAEYQSKSLRELVSGVRPPLVHNVPPIQLIFNGYSFALLCVFVCTYSGTY